MRLRSVVFDTVWPAQEELRAECNHLWSKLRLLPWRKGARHEVPEARCNCGIHATADPETAANYLYLYGDLREPRLRYRAIGRVSLWGSIVEGESGWRASHAYPQELYLPHGDLAGRRTNVEAVRDGLSRYGIPIELLDDDGQTPVAKAVRDRKPARRFWRDSKSG